jgi:hypothetical protein
MCVAGVTLPTTQGLGVVSRSRVTRFLLGGRSAFGWVTADQLYGQVSRIRLWLEELDIPHVLAVLKSQMVMTMEFFGQARAHALVGQLPDASWRAVSCGNGAHGPREYDSIRP